MQNAKDQMRLLSKWIRLEGEACVSSPIVFGDVLWPKASDLSRGSSIDLNMDSSISDGREFLAIPYVEWELPMFKSIESVEGR